MHLGVQGDYNNVHPHIRCEQESLIIGTYYNSENNISHYFGRNFKFNDWELDIALVTGYLNNSLQPMIRLKSDNWYISPMYEKEYKNSHIPNINYGLVIGYEIQFK